MAMTIHSIHVSSRKIVSQLFFTVLLYLYFPLIVNVFRGVLASNFCCCFTYFFTLLAAVTFSAAFEIRINIGARMQRSASIFTNTEMSIGSRFVEHDRTM